MQKTHFAGVSLDALAETYGTPLILYDEAMIRQRIQTIHDVLRSTGVPYHLSYACKAFCARAMVELAADMHIGLDVVSGGELYTAMLANFPGASIHFNGNNKSLSELALAVDYGVGHIILDQFQEIHHLVHVLKQFPGRRQRVLLRVTPGVHADTHHYIQTGQEDSKFGFDLESGQVHRAIDMVLTFPQLELVGLHMHIGSQITRADGYLAAVKRLLEHLPTLPPFSLNILNLGGGMGIRHTPDEVEPDLGILFKTIVEGVVQLFDAYGRDVPELWFEPGRSIVGPAGATLYTVGAIKDVPGIRTFAAVDGGMSDNIRPALYGARYTAFFVGKRARPSRRYTIVGKLCESGDVLIQDIELPELQDGDRILIPATGAYTYAMASHYNRLPRPAVVFVRNGEAHLVVRRETYDDVVRLDLPLHHPLESQV